MRQRPTTADYMLAGIAPAMIIGMINCLVFFLIMVVYRGDFSVRLMYILGLYTFGSVLIARIAIEQSRALATTYTSIIGLATLFVVMRFVEFQGAMALFSLPIVVGFLVLIGFLADRITFDCTLIDEQQDASGEGLLQSLGMLRSTIQSKKKKHNPGVWVLYFSLLALPLFGLGQLAIPASETLPRAWAFWFLFGYLLFGLALLLATSFLGLRRYLRQRQVAMPASMASVWMIGGSIGILGLLLVASILPLPGRSAGLISLPAYFTSPTNLQASRYGWGEEGTRSSSEDQDNSAGKEGKQTESNTNQEDPPDGPSEKNAPSSNDPKRSADPKGSEPSESGKSSGSKKSEPNNENSKQANGEPNRQPQENQPSNKQPADKQPADKQSNDKQPSDKQPSDKQPSDKQPSDKQANDKQANDKSTDQESDTSKSGEEKKQVANKENSGDGQSTNPPESNSQPTTWRMPELGGLPNLIKWITIAVLCLVIAVYLILHGSKLLAALRALFAPKSETTKSQPEPANSTPQKVARPFSTYPNPFSNSGPRMNPAEVIRYTFEAVEAWGREHSVSRQQQETPEEYLQRLSRKYVGQAEMLNQLAIRYNGLAYSSVPKIAPSDSKQMQQLWSFLYQEQK